MGNVVGPGRFHSDDRRSGGGLLSAFRNFVASFTEIVRRYGAKGLVALIVAALFAFAPLTLLYWYNELRPAAITAFATHQSVVVKPARHEEEQEREEPGETALLQVICETTISDTTRSLLLDDDPRRRSEGFHGTLYVRREMVYLRLARRDPPLPFALLGKPPVSAWLPAGNYEILVVHEAPRADSRIDARAHGFPLLSEFSECPLENKQKTVCRISLPHYDSGMGTPLELVDSDDASTDRAPSDDELAALLESCESASALPTPGGYILALAEPAVRHDDEHRRCTVDFRRLQAVPREWTREQLALLRRWLPDEAAAARTRLGSLVDALLWREFFQGWYCYATAGVAGLIFTRWGALAMVEPWRRGKSFRESVVLLVKILVVSILALFVVRVLND